MQDSIRRDAGVDARPITVGSIAAGAAAGRFSTTDRPVIPNLVTP